MRGEKKEGGRSEQAQKFWAMFLADHETYVTAVARKLFISEFRLRRYVCGERKTPLSLLFAIKRLYEMSDSYFLAWLKYGFDEEPLSELRKREKYTKQFIDFMKTAPRPEQGVIPLRPMDAPKVKRGGKGRNQAEE